MAWSTSPPSPIVKPGWTTDPTIPRPPSGQRWWVVLSVESALTIQWVTDLELQALKNLDLVRAVAASRSLALQAVYQLAADRQILVTRNLALQGTFQQDLALAVTMERAMFLSKVIGVDLAQALSMTRTIDLQAIHPIDLTQNLTAPRSINLGLILPVGLTRTITMSSNLVAERVAKIDAALTVTMARSCTLGYPPTGLPATQLFNTAGAHSWTFPRNCDFIDCIALGAGGGGASSGTFYTNPGYPGEAGAWATGTINRATDIAVTVTQVTDNVGTGGTRGSGGFTGTAGQPGGNTTISATGWAGLTAAGGLGGKADATGSTRGKVGKSPGNISYNGQPYTGGTGSSVAPGSGGNGGNSFGGAGVNGAIGQTWYRAYQ